MADYDLKSALAQVHGTPWNFGLYRGEDSDQILITAVPPGRPQVAKLEAECGRVKLILKGICYHDRAEGTLVFATKLPAAPAWEKMISAVLSARKCSHVLPISLRQLHAGESEEVDADALLDPETRRLKLAWEELKSTLLPDVKTALTDPAKRESIGKQVATASAHEKAAEYWEAIQSFEAVARTLGVLVPGVPPPAEPQALPAPAPARVAAPPPPPVVAVVAPPPPPPAPVDDLDAFLEPEPPPAAAPEPPAPPAPADDLDLDAFLAPPPAEPPPAATPPAAPAAPAPPAAADDLDDLMAALGGDQP